MSTTYPIIRRMMTEAEVAEKKKFYKNIRNGMSYDEAFDIMTEGWMSTEGTKEILESSQTDSPKKLYELNEENFTITEVKE